MNIYEKIPCKALASLAVNFSGEFFSPHSTNSAKKETSLHGFELFFPLRHLSLTSMMSLVNLNQIQEKLWKINVLRICKICGF